MTILSSINFPSGQFNSMLSGLVDLRMMIIPMLKNFFMVQQQFHLC